MSGEYHNKLKIKNIQRLRELQAELPEFMEEFFRGISETTAARTRIAYAYDLKIFFTFLLKNMNDETITSLRDLKFEILESIQPEDIEKFLEYISYYTKEENGQSKEVQNEERGKSRKLAAIRTMYTYFYKKRKIKFNPSELVDFPKIHEKTITRLEVNEVAMLLDEVESGSNLTERQKKFHSYTKERDLAIVTLLLGTGMRVSECVGINISDINFDMNGVRITRKGGDESVLYFGKEVEEALLDYLVQREKMKPAKGHENALFLSLQNKRLTDRAVQLLVKKYSKLVTSLKKISPHKLRSTYGTSLYRETGDIYLVADVLGHADVNTTRKHYAQLEEDRRRQAAKYVKLRKED